VLPPPSRLPPIQFPDGSSIIGQAAAQVIGDIIWALERWNAHEVRVVGYASSNGSRSINAKLALSRSRAVLEALNTAGISGTAIGSFLAYNQRDDEREYGLRAFQRVDVELAQGEIISSPPMPAAPSTQSSTPNSTN